MDTITYNDIWKDMATLFAELTTKWIQIPDNNNHIENFIEIIGQKIMNRQYRADTNLNFMLNTIWHIISKK